MSRRESRVSMGVRQNDALLEFETFKKKFLLANKHITKLNSTLSMKIEELNTEISTLYSENLRLRASEIALAAQLKRERDKSRKIMSDAEAAAQALTAHFTLLRQTFNIPEHAPPSPAATPPRLSPRSSGTSTNNPNVPRLAREPQVPNINEDEEPEETQHSPPRKKKKDKERRLSASRLPLPARVSTPPPAVPPAAPVISAPLPPPSLPAARMDLAALQAGKKQRRQSGLLLDLAVIDLDAIELDDGNDREAERKEKERERKEERERRRRSRDEGACPPDATAPPAVTTVKPKSKPKLKDVTNADRPPPLPLALESPARAFLVAAPPSPPPPEPKPAPVPVPLLKPAPPQTQSQKPVSSGSSSSLDAAACEPSEPGAESEAGGRERRQRKSVNYAEPKLNTKMRKPEPPVGSVPACVPMKRARLSAAAAIPSARSSGTAVQRRPSPPLDAKAYGSVPPDDDDDDDDEDGEESDVWADGEYVPAWATHVNVDGRRRGLGLGGGGRRTGDREGEWAREREREGRRHSAI
ncbi:hypothetical protein B0H15DRAFT_935159 [Mycena belliarum]|uniref:Shugoshin C-terminal domain-containing protein n=1 Tax=Mycena belliarum TaxID=1033014 RepID=A0AAD6XGL3_9AGAR|nr:hypothetical protein B0H15DRAFT_935159 [Mycena belliae]